MDVSWELKHVGMVVKDMDQSLEFYKSLGFEAEPVNDLAIDPGLLQVNGQPTTETIKLKTCNIQKAGLTLELIQPVAGDFIHMQTLTSEGEGVNHIFFSVPDLKAEKDVMIKNGFPFVFGNDGFAFFDTRAVGNLLIELGQQ